MWTPVRLCHALPLYFTRSSANVQWAAPPGAIPLFNSYLSASPNPPASPHSQAPALMLMTLSRRVDEHEGGTLRTGEGVGPVCNLTPRRPQVKLSRVHAFVLLTLIPAISAASCDVSSLGDLSGLLNIFGPSIRIIIENKTGFTAVPRIYTGNGTNFVDDLLNDSPDQVTAFGDSGTIPPGQSATISIPCEGDTEMIRFGGAEFKESSGHGVGDINSDNRLRKSNDYNCSDTIRIQLTGSTRNFRADVDVEAAPNPGGLGGSDQSNDDEDESLADQLDAIFGT